MKTLPLILAGALLAGPALATEPTVAVGHGTRSCSEFLAVTRNNRLADNNYYSWAEGFWSLSSMSRIAANRPYKDLTTAPLARDQLVNYCHLHTKDVFFKAVIAVYDDFLDAN
jgi:hypothetical protein